MAASPHMISMLATKSPFYLIFGTVARMIHPMTPQLAPTLPRSSLPRPRGWRKAMLALRWEPQTAASGGSASTQSCVPEPPGNMGVAPSPSPWAVRAPKNTAMRGQPSRSPMSSPSICFQLGHSHRIPRPKVVWRSAWLFPST